MIELARKKNLPAIFFKIKIMKKHPATPARAVKPEKDIGKLKMRREGLNPRDAAFFFSSEVEDSRDPLRHQPAHERLGDRLVPKHGITRGRRER